MAVKRWEKQKCQHCDHVDDEVTLEAEVVYPADMMPDQEPRVLAHRCSRALECNLFCQSTCIWAGTNPVVDPFQGK
ncbi:MAG TPA: hypothetical protein VIO61_01775 [Anaerolineaceae bacterium]